MLYVKTDITVKEMKNKTNINVNKTANQRNKIPLRVKSARI